MVKRSIPSRRSRLIVVGLSLAVTGLMAIALPAGAAARPAVTPAMSRLHTSGSTILDASGKVFRIKAANWFGLETQTCAPDGLWQINLDSGMAQIAGFGFNAIRLPYSNECIEHTTAVSNIDFAKNPTLKGKTPLQVMDAVIASAKAHGLRTILDQHRPDSAAQSPLWYTPAYPESTWIADWKMLAKRYAAEPAVIGADLHNEPNGAACWGCGDQTRDWAAAATRGGNAILSVDPHLLIVVEGVDQSASGQYAWWGGQLADVTQHPITLKVAHQLVYSAHDYPPSIYAQPWFSAGNYPANLPSVWNQHFGFIAEQHIAPVLIGEFGTRLQTTADKQWLSAMVTYLNANQLSFAYWSFNPDSGDTGGLVQDDWVTPQAAKLAALKPLFTATTSTTAAPTATSTAVTGRTTTTVAPTTATAPVSATSTAPRTPAPSTGVTVTAAPVADVSTGWSIAASWDTGYVAKFVIKARVAVTGWTISWPDPGATAIADQWGMTCSVSRQLITCSAADWGATIAAGGTADVGLQVTGNGQTPIDPPVTIR